MKGNAGFSLVELIIVIAIMAALVAILAPQYIKYVEKSRQSADISAADSILSACKTVALDPMYYDDASGGFAVTWTKPDTGSDGIIDCDVNALDSAIQELVGNTVAFKSKDFATVTFTYVPASTDEGVTTQAHFTVGGPDYITSVVKG
ncbi:MAG TPA: hypothetical protein DC001_03325 [Clostridiales bacterium]|nr:hypothetical protein [Clostridiales bacterium]